MKIIVEVTGEGSVYLYKETERIFKSNEKFRLKEGSTRADIKLLKDECYVGAHRNKHFVFNV